MKKSYKELLTNTVVFAVSSILSKVLLMLLLPVYTNTLTPEQYGTIELATNLSLLLIPFVSFAIQDAVFRFTVDNSIDRLIVFKTSFWVLSFGGLLLGVCSIVLYFYEPLRIWRWWFWCFSVLSMFRSALCLYTKGTEHTTVFAIDGIVYNLILAVTNIVLLCFFKLRIEGYFSALIIAQSFSIIYLLWNVEKPSFRELIKLPIDSEIAKIMLLYSAPLVLNSISWNLAHTVDRIMLESMRTKADVGIYSVASKIPSLISTIMSIFIQAWSISAIRSYGDKDGKDFYSSVFQYVEMMLVLVTIFVLLINNHVVVLLFGSEFRQAVMYTPILMIATSTLFYSNYFGPIFSSVKKSKLLMQTTLTGTVINVVLNYLLIARWGIYGATAATLASNTVISFLRMYLARKIYPFKVDWFILAVGWGLIIFSCCSAMMAGEKAEVYILCALIFAVIIYRKELKVIISQILHKLKRV